MPALDSSFDAIIVSAYNNWPQINLVNPIEEWTSSLNFFQQGLPGFEFRGFITKWALASPS